MSEELQALIEAYSRNPVGYEKLETFDISYEQGNSLCGDFLTVYLQIVEDKVTAFGYDGAPEMHTIVAASLLVEEIIGKTLDEILTREIEWMNNL